MVEKSPSERIAVLETAEQYDRRTLEEVKEELAAVKQELRTFREWKQACEDMSKIQLRIAMGLSMIATSIGVWLENIKAFLKGAIAWAGQ